MISDSYSNYLYCVQSRDAPLSENFLISVESDREKSKFYPTQNDYSLLELKKRISSSYIDTYSKFLKNIETESLSPGVEISDYTLLNSQLNAEIDRVEKLFDEIVRTVKELQQEEPSGLLSLLSPCKPHTYHLLDKEVESLSIEVGRLHWEVCEVYRKVVTGIHPARKKAFQNARAECEWKHARDKIEFYQEYTKNVRTYLDNTARQKRAVENLDKLVPIEKFYVHRYQNDVLKHQFRVSQDLFLILKGINDRAKNKKEGWNEPFFTLADYWKENARCAEYQDCIITFKNKIDQCKKNLQKLHALGSGLHQEKVSETAFIILCRQNSELTRSNTKLKNQSKELLKTFGQTRQKNLIIHAKVLSIQSSNLQAKYELEKSEEYYAFLMGQIRNLTSSSAE